MTTVGYAPDEFVRFRIASVGPNRAHQFTPSQPFVVSVENADTGRRVAHGLTADVFAQHGRALTEAMRSQRVYQIDREAEAGLMLPQRSDDLTLILEAVEHQAIQHQQFAPEADEP